MVDTQQGSVLYVSTKIEADSSIRSKVIKGPKIWKLGHSRDPDHAHLGSFYGPHAGGVGPLSLYQI